ncbi:MAG: hypothetical protein EZS28_052967 [Streblomastix strix]|uniref:Uncharacterized protein n=1 Tax=Streblomastix strix TaxID=222440 RepID=A0A5J4RP55_9EUKA|nr:MAG: hypothetical protein EZS28_052967 [Streblomastix strix]
MSQWSLQADRHMQCQIRPIACFRRGHWGHQYYELAKFLALTAISLFIQVESRYCASKTKQFLISAILGMDGRWNTIQNEVRSSFQT